MDEDKVPEQKKERFNNLAEKLEAAIAKRREANKGATQRNQLGAVRKAIREARQERNETREILGNALDASLTRKNVPMALDVEHAALVIEGARERNLLQTFRAEIGVGKPRDIELAAVKGQEDMSNRPAVRANKKHRSKGMSGPSI